MRFYAFGNYYLSSLQQGLQAGHCIGDLSVQSVNLETKTITEKGMIYFTWANLHKVMVLLKGGNSQSLAEIYQRFQKFEQEGMHLPYVKFHEDEQSLGGALTDVGIIVEAKYYETAYALRNQPNPLVFVNDLIDNQGCKQWEVELITELNKYPLAN